jgi:hypothetical protein
MTHGLENIIPNVFVIFFQVIQKVLDVETTRRFSGWTAIFNDWKAALFRVFFDQILAEIGQRPDDMQAAAEDLLIGHHGTDFPGVKHVDQQGLNNVVAVMGKGNLIATSFGGNLEYPFSSEPGTEKARVLLVELTV